MIKGTDSKGNPVEIRPGQQFTLRKRRDLVYELAADGSHRRIHHKPTSKQRRRLVKMRKAQMGGARVD